MLLQKIIDCEFKADADAGTFDAYGNAFHVLDSAGEIVAPGAFTDTLPQFLQQGFIGGIGHNWEMPIGRPLAAKEDAKGLFVSAKISDTTYGQDVRTLMKDGVLKKMSIGYKVQGDEQLETADDVADYWKEHKYKPTSEDVSRSQFGARLLTKLHLFEVSPVTVPANNQADITRVKRYEAEDLQTWRQFEKFLRDVGQFSFEDAKTLISRFKADLLRDVESRETPPPPEDEEKTADETDETPAEDAGVFVASPPPALSPALQREAAKLFADFERISLRRLSAPSR